MLVLLAVIVFTEPLYRKPLSDKSSEYILKQQSDVSKTV